MKHTSGPRKTAGVQILGPHPKDPKNRTRIIAKAIWDKGTYLQETKANARLLAAAPDLFEALKCVVAAMKKYEIDTDESPTYQHRDIMARATAAIAKAEGTS